MINRVVMRLILSVLGVAGLAVGQSTSAPTTAEGHPDLNGYWKGTRDTKPGGNIAKDLPGLKLPLTPAGEVAWKHNTTATIDPESLCILGGIPRHNASGLPYTRSFTYARTWVLGKPDEQLHEYSCAENNIDKEHLGFGPGPIRPDGTRGYVDPAPLPPLPAPTKK